MERFFAAGAVLSALAASTCCVLPLALVFLGVGGAWIGTFTALAPYQPVFLAFALICLAGGFWLIYRRKPLVEGEACYAPRLIRNMLWIKGALWVGASVVVATVGADLGARALL